jgi:hypothetical protein
MPVSYAEVCKGFELRRRYSGVAEDEDESYYGTDEALYQGIISLLADEYLEERYSLCLEIRDGDRVVHAFPKVACPELILEQLQLKGLQLKGH